MGICSLRRWEMFRRDEKERTSNHQYRRTMRIMVPCQEDKGSETRMSRHFGRAPYLAVADSDTGEIEMRPNDPAGHGDRGCGAVERIRELDVEAVVCRSLGAGALAGLQALGIEVYRSEQPTMAGAIAEVRDGKAERFESDRTCEGRDHGHHHGRSHRHDCHGRRGARRAAGEEEAK